MENWEGIYLRIGRLRKVIVRLRCFLDFGGVLYNAVCDGKAEKSIHVRR